MVLDWKFHPMDNSPNSHELELLLPQSVTRPLWRSLLSNLRDRLFPEKLPPLQITSRPLNTGMLIGDAVSLPWYRTVFTNLGNVINPEVLPPLELESRPLDVGELVSDQMGHMWWTSLLRNLADRVAPERLPALQLTSTPVDASLKSGSMQLARWSSLISYRKFRWLNGRLLSWRRRCDRAFPEPCPQFHLLHLQECHRPWPMCRLMPILVSCRALCRAPVCAKPC